jgi:hypothetical protein
MVNLELVCKLCQKTVSQKLNVRDHDFLSRKDDGAKVAVNTVFIASFREETMKMTRNEPVDVVARLEVVKEWLVEWDRGVIDLPCSQ